MYGLLGKNVSHSYSSEIYKDLGYSYNIMDLEENQFETFIHNKAFEGINVTMPYKEIIVQHLDEMDDIVKEIGVVNTVVKRDGKLTGYNTDYFGLKYLLKHNDVDVINKKVLILGSGATSKTAAAVFRDLKAAKIVKVSRDKKGNAITYEDLELGSDFEIIINTTPVGMYPNVEEDLVDLSLFKNLETVIDVIYNPLNTKLIVLAKNLGVKAVGGLEMLVAQAVKSAQLFFDVKIDYTKIDELYKEILLRKLNVVLVGMPTAGKTTIGRKLASKMDKQFKDVDYIIVGEQGKTIREIFTHDGEDFFRMLESSIIFELSKSTNTVIATGGGSVLQPLNVERLKQNGIIVFINRPLELLFPDQSRPLTASEDSLEDIFNKRFNTYKNICDVEIINNESIEIVVEKIMEAILCVY